MEIKKIITLITYTIAVSIIHTHVNGKKAVIIVPVADLVGQQLCNGTSYDGIQLYNQMPVCGGAQQPGIACPRIHQLLYNDIVDIVKTTDNEAYICISQAVYYTASKPQTHYWTLKKNLMPLDHLAQKKLNPAHIPTPIDYTKTHNTLSSTMSIITLKQPHYDANTDTTFSAGTRFVCAQAPVANDTTTSVFAIKFTTMHEYCIDIPTHKCALAAQKKSPTQQINDYVALLKNWANNADGFIPYTWGGTSFTTTAQGSYTEIVKKTSHGQASYYQFNTPELVTQKTGLDCSGAILRAAQICGIPYFCKNSSSITHCLTALPHNAHIATGDILVIQGHVMVVSDLKNNLLIEARSYGHGYGKLHEIALSDVFDSIHTYDDLINAYRNKKVIKRKDKSGTIRDSFNTIALVQIASAWK